MRGRQLPVALVFCAALAAVLTAGIGAGLGVRDEGRRPARSGNLPEPSVSATAFLGGIIRLVAANDYAAAWSRLDPTQQRLVPRDSYVRCESTSPIPGRLARIEVVRVRREQVVVPGSRLPARASVVATFRVDIESTRPGEAPVAVRVTAHALQRDGEWTWMLPAKRLALHLSGRCVARPVADGPSS